MEATGNIHTTLRDILAKVSEQKSEFKQYVDNKVDEKFDGISAQIQGASCSVAAEVKKLKAERDFSWKR